MGATRAILLGAFMAAFVGCDDRRTTARMGDDRSPVQYFKEQQKDTVTPNGRIVVDSVESADGKIRYRTEDGKTWRVGYTRRADGTFRFDTPEEVK